MKHSARIKKAAKGRKRPARKTKAGALLRAAREKKGMTLRDVEEGTGLLSGGISHIENGRNVPTIKTAVILCAFYRLPLKRLVAAVVDDDL